jgi:CRISPR/Cas system-associated endoribonuclease Cas2
MEKRRWIAMNYNLPTEPSRHRVAAWRALKKLGAVNVQQSMWVLAYNEKNYSSLEKIASDIENNQGEALLLDCVFFEKKHEDRVISLFHAVRDEEYQELINECVKYLKELEKEISIEKFTFAELEEEEEELTKLLAWYDKIAERDLFGAPESDSAKEKLLEIKQAFDEYSTLVYQHNSKESN